MTTTIVKDVASKFAVATVAAAMIFSAYAPAAQAQTTEDLQQMINDLLAQVAQLQAQAGGGASAPAGAPGVCPYTWTRDLTQGSEGADVMKLQQFLNSYPDLRVAATGAGSMGMETMYYGPATAAAVSKMQVMFRAEVLTPNGLVNPTGYFGASSRAKANDLCVADTTPVDMEEDEDGMMDDEDEDDSMSAGLSGEGTLTMFEVDDEETEVSEGVDDEVVMVMTLEAEDGDVEVSRLSFLLTPGGTNEENDAYDVFTEVSLWVDGDKIASFEADDEDEYLDEDTGEFRFSNLDLVLREDDETEVLVAVSVMNSVDGSDTTTDAEWTLDVTEVRYFDADGVATTDDEVDELGDGPGGATDNETVTFDIEEEGTDDGADLEGNSNTPDAATLLVDEDTDDSDEFLVHLFDIEVDRDSGDLEVNDVYATTTITNANPAAAIADGQADVIDGIFMTIDGETVEGEAVETGSLANDDEDAPIALNGGATSVVWLFEFDGDVVLEGDEDYEAEITIVFKGQDGKYVNGVTVQTEVNGADWEVEGSNNDNALSGVDESELHTLATVIPVISDAGFTVDRNENGAGGTISYEFTMEADGENDISFTFGDVNNVDGAADDVRFTIDGIDDTIATASISRVGGDDAALVGNVFTIEDGDSVDFVLDVTFTTVNAGDNGTYRVTLESIEGLEIDETSNGMSLSFVAP